MGTGVACEVCGNRIDLTLTSCPFCGAKRTPVYREENPELLRVVNLERGMPAVQDALQLLEQELQMALHHGWKVLLLIHGYGSSGEGGAIKEAVRSKLQTLRDRNELHDVLPGEECGRHKGHAKHILKRFPTAGQYLTQPNSGITIVII